MAVVEDFVKFYNAQEWDKLEGCFDATDFQRTGPFSDVVTGRTEYVAFLRRCVATMSPNYELQVERIVYAPDEKVAVGQFIEHAAHDDMPDGPEVIVYDLNDEGLIRRMCLYMQRPDDIPPGAEDAMGVRPG
jgi:hypothetical protein